MEAIGEISGKEGHAFPCRQRLSMCRWIKRGSESFQRTEQATAERLGLGKASDFSRAMLLTETTMGQCFQHWEGRCLSPRILDSAKWPIKREDGQIIFQTAKSQKKLFSRDPFSESYWRCVPPKWRINPRETKTAYKKQERHSRFPGCCGRETPAEQLSPILEGNLQSQTLQAKGDFKGKKIEMLNSLVCWQLP